MAETLRTWKTLLIIALFAGCVFARDNLTELRSKFASDTDPIHRAKLMRQLGRAEFQEIEKNADAGQYAKALAILQEYRDESRLCAKALDERQIDAEKHPNGFKQLQFSLRESLRRLDSLLVSLTADEQRPFLEVRQDLEDLDRHLLHELFPNEPAKAEPQAKLPS